MRGRKPKPTEQRILEGNAGKRRINDAEPTLPPFEDDAVPGELAVDAVASAYWTRLLPVLRTGRAVTLVDREPLVALCIEWSRYLKAITEVRMRGEIIATPSGYPMPNPYLSIARGALAQLRSLWAEFGLTPSSRSRVHAAGDDADPWAEFDQPPPTPTTTRLH